MFSGKVIHGSGIGKELGCATANLDVDPKKTQLREGVYAGKAIFENKEYMAAISIQHSKKKVEVHLLDYAGPDFYGSSLSAEAIQQVSQMEPLDTVAELREKIQKDLIMIRNIFEEELYE